MKEVYIIRHNNATTSVANYFDAIDVAVSLVQSHRDDKAIIYWTHELFANELSLRDCVDSSNVNDFARIAENHRIAESL